MDINDMRGITTLLVMIAFIGICVWAYSSRRKADFDEAAQLPFSDEDEEETMSKDKSREKKTHE